MTLFDEIITKGKRVSAHRPVPRVVVDATVWTQAVHAFADERTTLLGL